MYANRKDEIKVENLAMIVVCMALPTALCFLFAIGDIVMDILYYIFPELAGREAKEIERLERWQEEE